ncbi:MAG: RnfH family protein [Pseudomonadota bacterium]
MADSGPLSFSITLVYSPAPREVFEQQLQMPVGATVQQVLDTSELATRYPALDSHTAEVGIWGRLVDRAQTVQDQDRVEIYRALKVDPKVARRERFVQQGSRSAGLFARKRPGAKSGY